MFKCKCRAQININNIILIISPELSTAVESRLLRKVVRLMHQDLPGKAMQALLSNGTAEGTELVHSILCAMHPDRKEQLKPHKPTVDQVEISVETARKFLFRNAGADNSCIGSFGWKADDLLHIRGGGTEHTFMQAMAQLISHLANTDVPPITGFIVTCGSLFALHKLSPEKQAERRAKNLDPKLRPVNVPCSLLKWAFKLLLDSPQAEEAIAAMAPMQKGLKARSRGGGALVSSAL